MKARLVYADKSTREVEVEISHGERYDTARLAKQAIGADVDHVDMLYDRFTARAGDEGYLVTDHGTLGTYLTYFTEREDFSTAQPCSFVGCYGMCKNGEATLAIVTGMRCDFGMVVGVKSGHYLAYPRFYLDGDSADEDIVIRLYPVPEATYAAMACLYRDYQLAEGGCIPLRERVKSDPRLARAADAVEIRVRQGWKPVPSPVEYQTPETEPPMHVACTFDRVGDVAEALKHGGVDKAEMCLVGWNIGGHDGRFPQIFPPDPRLGGEERLRALIDRVKSLGYQIVCHDDATAAYTIADCFDEEYLLKNKDGSLHKRPYCWGGGKPHKVCPRREYERFETFNQPALAALGFEGLHYIDVITILPLLKCYDPVHPTTRAESAAWYRKTMRLARKLFGGFASEGAFDFAISDTDYVLYPTMVSGFDEPRPLRDELIPFWHIVYHGIVLYNPSTFTLNYPVKSAKSRLRLFEYGGRPLACYYANFAQSNNWMGKEDLLADTDEDIAESVARVRQMQEDYRTMEPERYEYMVGHERLAEDVFVTTYANGTHVTVDYHAETVKIERAH